MSTTTSSTGSSTPDEAVDLLSSMLGPDQQMPASVLTTLWNECDGNLDKAAEVLLQLDSMLDVAMQMQFREATPESDEDVARRLQSAWEDEDSHLAEAMAQRYAYTPPPRAAPAVELPEFDLTKLDSSQLDQLVKLVKKGMLPIMLDQVKQVQVPDIDEAADLPKVGHVEFGIHGLQMEDAQIPEEKVNVVMEGKRIIVSASDVSAKLRKFSWFYKKDSFPKIKDKGNAECRVANGTIRCVIDLGMNPDGSPSVIVSECTVQLAKLDIKISGTAVSVIYNLVIAMFKSLIKRTLEQALKNLITESVNNNQDLLSL
ncbi:lipopolysaccharide-binding protein [Pelomyxa schiedti]|nr:lipopolysaccharide-binding protein [Pelomyxa schiedti]